MRVWPAQVHALTQLDCDSHDDKTRSNARPPPAQWLCYASATSTMAVLCDGSETELEPDGEHAAASAVASSTHC